jgi:hypothetical protein
MNLNTGERMVGSEISSVDTAILICGALACREYFEDQRITQLATALYDRVNWCWMLNGGSTLSRAWRPEKGFSIGRWDTYAEEMMLYLLAMGSTNHAIPARCWKAWSRPVLDYQGLRYITSRAPLFIHQFSHAWIDFRNKRDAFADYFENSVLATRAHKLFCLSLATRFQDYAVDLLDISASDFPHGYAAWGGPPSMGPIDGSIVPSATAGSVPFLPSDCLTVLRNIRANFLQAWTRYGFVDSFNPLTGWYDPYVVGIGAGITLLMMENYRTQLLWNTFMKAPEIRRAMNLAGFQQS